MGWKWADGFMLFHAEHCREVVIVDDEFVDRISQLNFVESGVMLCHDPPHNYLGVFGYHRQK